MTGHSLSQKNLHHAYVLEGDRRGANEALKAFLTEELGLALRGNPDLHQETFDSMGIDDGRRLKERAIEKSFGGKKIFIIEARSITHEAQNSLLKLFEEPTADTHFFIITEKASNLLPTLRSRLAVINFAGKAGPEKASAEEFLQSTLGQRLTIAKSLVTDIANEKKDRSAAINFANELERALWESPAFDRTLPSNAEVLSRLERSRSYLDDRSASIKMILEYLAVAIPRLKTKNESA